VQVTTVAQILGMSVIYLLISISIVVAVAFFYCIFWCSKGQYDDDYTRQSNAIRRRTQD
jgi:cbb3-type cytochrome oxidase maturation protein